MKEVTLHTKSNFGFKVGVVMRMPESFVVVGQLEPHVAVYRPGKECKQVKQKVDGNAVATNNNLSLLQRVNENFWILECKPFEE